MTVWRHIQMSGHCVLFSFCSIDAPGFISLWREDCIITKQNKLECIFLAQSTFDRSYSRQGSLPLATVYHSQLIFNLDVAFLTWSHCLGPGYLGSLPLRREVATHTAQTRHWPTTPTDLTTSFKLVWWFGQFFDWINYSFHFPLTTVYDTPRASELVIYPTEEVGLTFLAAKDIALHVQWPWN